VPQPNKITPNTGGGFNANRSARPFVKETDLQLLQKLSQQKKLKIK
jgi:hypothetical protein